MRFTDAPTTASATAFYKMNEGDDLTQGSTVDIDDGKFDFLQQARWHRVRFNLTGDHKETGYAAALKKGGER